MTIKADKPRHSRETEYRYMRLEDHLRIEAIVNEMAAKDLLKRLQSAPITDRTEINIDWSKHKIPPPPVIPRIRYGPPIKYDSLILDPELHTLCEEMKNEWILLNQDIMDVQRKKANDITKTTLIEMEDLKKHYLPMLSDFVSEMRESIADTSAPPVVAPILLKDPVEKPKKTMVDANTQTEDEDDIKVHKKKHGIWCRLKRAKSLMKKRK